MILNVSTGKVNSALSIIRLSLDGINSFNYKYILYKLFKKNIPEKKINLNKIYYKNKIIEEGIILLYKKPFSFTGENLIEFIIHGDYNNCRYLLIKLKNFLYEFKIKFSKRGEFTKLAYLNKKLNIINLKKIFYKINKNNNFININLKNILLKLILFNNYIKHFIINNLKLKFNIKKNLIYFYNYFKNIIDFYNNKKILQIYVCGFPNTGKSTFINNIINKNNLLTSRLKGSTKNIIYTNLIFNNIKIKIYDTIGFNNSLNFFEKFFIKKFFKLSKKSNFIIYIFSNINSLYNIYYYKIKNLNIIYILNKIDLIYFIRSSFEIKFYKNLKLLFKLSCKKKLGLIFILYNFKKFINNFNKFINNNFNNINFIEILKKNILKIIIKKNYNLNKIILINKFIKNLINTDYYKNINKLFKYFCIGK